MIYWRSGDLFVGPAGPAGEPFRFLTTPASETLARFSPDSRWIAYSSNESGQMEVYVRPFSGAPAGPTGKLQVSHRGGEFAIWGPLGREIFYQSADGSIFSVDTRNLGRIETLPTPVRLFPACLGSGPLLGRGFDTSDGQRFLVSCPSEPPGRFTVLMNWTIP